MPDMTLSIALNRASKASAMLDEYRAAQMDPHADQHHVKVGLGHWREALAEAVAYMVVQHGYDDETIRRMIDAYRPR
jgi:hypothetical protein